MPIIKEYPSVKVIENTLQEMLKENNPEAIRKAFKKVLGFDDITFGETNNKPALVSFEETVARFKTSDRFLALETSSQKSYKSEIAILEKLFEKHFEKGVRTSVEKVLSPEVIRDYLSGVSEATKNKKKAFLRTFIKSGAWEIFKDKWDEKKKHSSLEWWKASVSGPLIYSRSMRY